MPSPLLADDLLYVLANNNNLLSCFDAKTGAVQFEAERLEGLTEMYASPVAAKGRVYVLGRDGTCLVLKQGAEAGNPRHEQALRQDRRLHGARRQGAIRPRPPISVLHRGRGGRDEAP